jgi:hypothetical protein
MQTRVLREGCPGRTRCVGGGRGGTRPERVPNRLVPPSRSETGTRGSPDPERQEQEQARSRVADVPVTT